MTGEHSFTLRAVIGSLCGVASIAAWIFTPKTLAPRTLAPKAHAPTNPLKPSPNSSLNPASRLALSPQRFSQLFLAAFAYSSFASRHAATSPST